MRNLKSAALMTAAIVMLAWANTARADVTETEEFSFPISDGGRLSLDNVNGDIKVTGGPGSEIIIVATKKASKQDVLDDIEINISADPDYVRVETELPKSFGWGSGNKGKVHYEVTVPAGIELNTIETVNGSVDISGVDGTVKAETVNGDLDIVDLSGDVNLETVNGSIRAEFVRLGEGQRVSADTVNGKIVLRLPGDASARVKAETVNGSIDADDFGLKATKGFVGRDLDGEIGEGDGRLSLDTVNGSIKLVRQ